MTQIVLNYSTSLFEVIYGFLQNIANSLMFARQLAANQEAAKLLSSSEYAGKEYQRILAEMNEATRKHYGK